MKCAVKRFTLIWLLIFLAVVLVAGSEWKLITDKDGVALYTREVIGRSEAQFKGVCIIKRPLEVVGSVLSDIPSYPRWFFKCIEAKKIPAEKLSELKFFLYVAIDTPWPFSDRDAIYKTEVTIDDALGKVLIQSIALNEPFIPLKKPYVRITDSELQWILERLAADRTRITFINRTNVAGPFANFLSNPGMRDTTLRSLINLKNILTHPDSTGNFKK